MNCDTALLQRGGKQFQAARIVVDDDRSNQLRHSRNPVNAYFGHRAGACKNAGGARRHSIKTKPLVQNARK